MLCRDLHDTVSFKPWRKPKTTFDAHLHIYYTRTDPPGSRSVIPSHVPALIFEGQVPAFPRSQGCTPILKRHPVPAVHGRKVPGRWPYSWDAPTKHHGRLGWASRDSQVLPQRDAKSAATEAQERRRSKFFTGRGYTRQGLTKENSPFSWTCRKHVTTCTPHRRAHQPGQKTWHDLSFMIYMAASYIKYSEPALQTSSDVCVITIILTNNQLNFLGHSRYSTGDYVNQHFYTPS